MSETVCIGLLFKEALLEYSAKHVNDTDICGVKIDLRSQNIDLIVGIRFVDGVSQFTVCTEGNNCEGANDQEFELLSDALQKIGVESKSGAGIMIKRNSQLVTTDEGCSTIEVSDIEEEIGEDAPKKRGGLFGLFGKK